LSTSAGKPISVSLPWAISSSSGSSPKVQLVRPVVMLVATGRHQAPCPGHWRLDGLRVALAAWAVTGAGIPAAPALRQAPPATGAGQRAPRRRRRASAIFWKLSRACRRIPPAGGQVAAHLELAAVLVDHLEIHEVVGRQGLQLEVGTQHGDGDLRADVGDDRVDQVAAAEVPASCTRSQNLAA
jgi:hypothetical protein